MNNIQFHFTFLLLILEIELSGIFYIQQMIFFLDKIYLNISFLCSSDLFDLYLPNGHSLHSI